MLLQLRIFSRKLLLSVQVSKCLGLATFAPGLVNTLRTQDLAQKLATRKVGFAVRQAAGERTSPLSS